MFKNAIITAAVTATLALGSVATAGATQLSLPDYAPVPVSRADALAAMQRAAIPHYPVVQIGTAPEAIPSERLDVRVVGARFLPDRDDSLALKTPGANGAGIVASLEAASVWVLRSASAGFFGEAVAAQDQTVASLD